MDGDVFMSALRIFSLFTGFILPEDNIKYYRPHSQKSFVKNKPPSTKNKMISNRNKTVKIFRPARLAGIEQQKSVIIKPGAIQQITCDEPGLQCPAWSNQSILIRRDYDHNDNLAA